MIIMHNHLYFLEYMHGHISIYGIPKENVTGLLIYPKMITAFWRPEIRLIMIWVVPASSFAQGCAAVDIEFFPL